MAVVSPLRGIRYDPTVVDLGRCLAPPYDVISDAQRESLIARDLRNVVRIDYGPPMEGDVKGVSDRYRCIAPDHPGFGLSRAPAGYRYTAAEHARVIEQLIVQLDLSDVTMMVQDWGGPIGFAAATAQPQRFAGFIVGNT